MAASSTRPSQEQVEDVVKKLAAFRDMLPEDEQRLVNAMFLAAIETSRSSRGTSRVTGTATRTPAGTLRPGRTATATTTPVIGRHSSAIAVASRRDGPGRRRDRSVAAT
jgi:hypothetical protein